MLKKSKKLNQESGFTIIEVLIVLAIAALILLIVFLAVPALQRNQRNNARKNDAARTAGAIVNFISNDPTGAPPNSLPDVTAIRADVGNYGQFTSANCTTAGTPILESVCITVATANVGPLAVTLKDSMNIVTKSICNNAVTGGTVFQTASSRKVALQYTLEVVTSGTTVSTPQCLDVN